MIKKIALLFFLLPFAALSFAQTFWKQEMYKEVNHSNFRNNPVFRQKLPAHVSYVDHGLVNATLFFLTNEFRTKNKKNALEYASALEIAAWNHAMQMAKHGFLSHDNLKEPDRRTIDDRAALAGITNPYLIESLIEEPLRRDETYLALGERLLAAWLNSEIHRKNLLSDSVQLGCGAYQYQSKWYGVQLFQNIEKVVTTSPSDKLPVRAR